MYVIATNLQICHNCKFISELWGKCQNCEIKSCNNFFVYIYIFIEMGFNWVFFQILCKTWGYKLYRRYNNIFLQQDQDLLAVKWHLRLSLSSFQHVLYIMVMMITGLNMHVSCLIIEKLAWDDWLWNMSWCYFWDAYFLYLSSFQNCSRLI